MRFSNAPSGFNKTPRNVSRGINDDINESTVRYLRDPQSVSGATQNDVSATDASTCHGSRGASQPSSEAAATRPLGPATPVSTADARHSSSFLHPEIKKSRDNVAMRRKRTSTEPRQWNVREKARRGGKSRVVAVRANEKDRNSRSNCSWTSRGLTSQIHSYGILTIPGWSYERTTRAMRHALTHAKRDRPRELLRTFAHSPITVGRDLILFIVHHRVDEWDSSKFREPLPLKVTDSRAATERGEARRHAAEIDDYEILSWIFVGFKKRAVNIRGRSFARIRHSFTIIIICARHRETLRIK